MELKNKQRIALSVFFFLSGICFASWTSRIPNLKNIFQLSYAELGTILLTMPIASMIGLPISGWLVARFDSRVPLSIAFTLLGVSVFGIAFSPKVIFLVMSLGVFSFSLRILNVSMNTQAITLQKMFDKKINGSFHGLWSTGGIVGLLFATLLLRWNIPMNIHLSIIAAITIVTTIVTYRFLVTNDRATSGNKIIFGKPDPYIGYLGLLIFFAAICEGGMFDWSGQYFHDVIGVEVYTTGHLLFMVWMALARFASDYLIVKLGMPKMYALSALLIIVGIFIAIVFPYYWPTLIGFSLVGFGTGPVIPMTFLLAGGSRKYSTGMAVSLLATYSIVGMLIGPPLIGYISEALNLKLAFITFALAAFMLIPISQLFFRHKRSLE
ncbi:MFS transporter [Pseudochryseolinea flava]|uniref:MFS transporter n=1 Tax=Pseudochryseolinea flava TaxID=2059302 RepID=A0A364Y8Z7_9BACT|nr:MFS transporter [Pseudochryseolinea flava]RAW02955.1 MFS transporter [Pseudochryseolinea flava]